MAPFTDCLTAEQFSWHTIQSKRGKRHYYLSLETSPLAADIEQYDFHHDITERKVTGDNNLLATER